MLQLAQEQPKIGSSGQDEIIEQLRTLPEQLSQFFQEQPKIGSSGQSGSIRQSCQQTLKFQVELVSQLESVTNR